MNSIIGNERFDKEADITERYAYKRGGRYINEYARTLEDGTRYEGDPENPNHLLGSFPTLFPYGAGGFETNRLVKVTYEKHIRWALCYHDKRLDLQIHSWGLYIDFKTDFVITNNSYFRYSAYFKSAKSVALYHFRFKNLYSINMEICYDLYDPRILDELVKKKWTVFHLVMTASKQFDNICELPEVKLLEPMKIDSRCDPKSGVRQSY